MTSKSKKSKYATTKSTSLGAAHQGMKSDHETSNIEQSNTTEPKWIPVGELGDYYAKHKPIGRRYPVQSQLDFDNLYIDESRDEIQDSESETSNNKQGAKPTRKPTGKSTATSGPITDAKSASVLQWISSRSTKGKDKSKMSNGKYSEEDGEESSEEDEKQEEDQAEDPNTERYKSCDTCFWARVKCVVKEGDKRCQECEKRGRNCHFSIKGQRPLHQPPG
ncbi:hypothetical protein M436DRAFT_62742 [Aureobasidium namibiae CBS 147.97]|uniref:Zn(2)-C6 fungal-type domain-containing protein n=1 Tax=Aureobasidium namibiae CBS 147.97 TaxID=1043004 RepID=A0A074WMG7_9PEZI